MVRFFVFFSIAVVAVSMIAADPKDGAEALLVVSILAGVALG